MHCGTGFVCYVINSMNDELTPSDLSALTLIRAYPNPQDAHVQRLLKRLSPKARPIAEQILQQPAANPAHADRWNRMAELAVPA